MLTDQRISEMLCEIASLTNATKNRNDTFQSKKYFFYKAGFPHEHIGVDNRAGTTRLFSIDSETDFNKFMKKL